MPFDVTKYLVCSAITENVDPDIEGAHRIALATSLLDMPLLHSAVIARVLAENQASPVQVQAPAEAVARLGSPRLRRRAIPAATIKVPSVRHLADAAQIQDHLNKHKLRTRIHRESLPDIKQPRVVRQWPSEESEVLEGAEINVLLVVPEDTRRPEPETRTPKK